MKYFSASLILIACMSLYGCLKIDEIDDNYNPFDDNYDLPFVDIGQVNVVYDGEDCSGVIDFKVNRESYERMKGLEVDHRKITLYAEYYSKGSEFVRNKRIKFDSLNLTEQYSIETSSTYCKDSVQFQFYYQHFLRESRGGAVFYTITDTPIQEGPCVLLE